MSTLNEDALSKAVTAFWNGPDDTTKAIEMAVETYIAEAFKPGAVQELVVGEAIQPQRDYRKELWIAHWASVPANTFFCKAVESAKHAVRAFDEFFAEGDAQ